MGTNSSCDITTLPYNDDMHFLYAIVYTVILIPGFIANLLALWVFYAYVKETKRAVIFMINLAIADLAQVLTLPLRIFYYLNRTWHFGKFLCIFCFYLKYVNMYASIYFLVCISVRRCLYLIYPFRYNDSKRRYDVYVCIVGWIVVGFGCLPFPLMRMDLNQTNFNICFADLPVAEVETTTSIIMVTLAELAGFVIPLIITGICSWKTIMSLRETSVLNDHGEKRKALKMILTCTIVFLICFMPYHISFPLDYLNKSGKISNCISRKVIENFHPVALSLASLNCCLDPIIYYFTTDEFRRRLSRQDVTENMIPLHSQECTQRCSISSSGISSHKAQFT